MSKIISNLIIVITFLICMEAAAEETQQEALIKGVTNFLAERANANAEYTFENKIKNNSAMQCYLPNTSETIQNVELNLLLRTNNQVWKEKITEDIRFASLLFLLIKLDKNHIEKINVSDLSYFINKTLIDNSNIKNITIDEVTTDIKSFQKRLDWLNGHKDKCGFSIDSEVAGIEGYSKFLNQLVSQLKIKSIPPSSDELKDLVTNFWNIYKYTIPNKDSKDPNINYVAAAVDLLNVANGHIDSKKDEIKKVKNYLLFFASLADAKSSQQVTSILEVYVLPPVSFGEKRESYHWFVSSYVGLDYSSYNIARKDTPLASPNNQKGVGVYAPIGFEISTPNGDWGPIAFMLAPFDFGYPLSLKMTGSNTAVNLNDVVSPSIAVSYGLKDYPNNWGIAWQRVNRNQNNNEQSSRLLIFFSFDMPLYVIH